MELGSDQGGIDDRALALRHALCAEVGFESLKDLLVQLVLLQQMAEGQDRRLIRDLVTDQLDAGQAAHGGHLDQGLFHGRVAERIPLLQEMNPQHHDQRVRRSTALFAGLGVVRLDQRDQRRPRHHYLHLREKLFPFGLLLGRGQLVIREAELLGHHHPSPVLRLQAHFRVDRLGFSELPWMPQGNQNSTFPKVDKEIP